MRRPGWEPNIDGGHKPSVKAPDPSKVTDEDLLYIETFPDDELRQRLLQRDVHPDVVEDLIRDRDTNGGRWRIVQELCR